MAWKLPITFCWGRHPHPTHSPYHKLPTQWRNCLSLAAPAMHQCLSSPPGPNGGTLPQTLWTACLWAGPCIQGNLGRAPQLQMVRGPTLEQGTQPELQSEAFSQDTDLVKEARKEYFKRHSYNFTLEDTHNLSEVFRWMAKSANLLGTAIHEIQVVWMGPDKLWHVNYALRSLPKGLKFFHAVPPSESPKVMGLVGIHHPDTLCHFNGFTHCPSCGNEGQNEGTVVKHQCRWCTTC